MVKNIFIFILSAIPFLVCAKSTIGVDGLYYNLDTDKKEAEVASANYSGYVKIPESFVYEGETYQVTSIGYYAFGNGELTSVDIPKTIKKVDDLAFGYCRNLSYVNISNIEAWCKIEFSWNDSNPIVRSHCLFLNGVEITDLIIPEGITSINNYAFDGWSNLKSVIIPGSVTSVGVQAFNGCTGLTSIILPNSITSINHSAFSGCTGLTSVILPNAITSINQDTFAGCTALKNITIPSNVQNIQFNAFKNSGLESITIPEGVTEIQSEAFMNCQNLYSVILPSSIKTIGNNVFSCPKLTVVYCYSKDIPNTSETAFGSNYEWDNNSIWNGTLYVPSESVNMYKRISPWSYFGNIIEIKSEGGDSHKCSTPTICYQNGKLMFHSAPDGVSFQYSITDSDIKTGSSQEVELDVTYNISVYATKEGYESSETATATLCWIDVEPKTEGIENGLAQVRANPVLIQANNGKITVNGADDGTNVSVYSTNGVLSGTAISHNGSAVINTNFQVGSVAIVKIGDKSVKIVLK